MDNASLIKKINSQMHSVNALDWVNFNSNMHHAENMDLNLSQPII